MAATIASTYTEDEKAAIVSHVCEQVSAGRGLVRVLQEDDGMPSWTTWWRWAWNDPDLETQVVRARERGVEARLTKAQHIADLGEIVPLDGLSGVELERAMLQRDPKVMKLRIDAEIKFAQMLKPKTYGPKLDLTTDGNALNKPAPDAADKAAALLGDVARRTGIAPRDIAVPPSVKDLLS